MPINILNEVHDAISWIAAENKNLQSLKEKLLQIQHGEDITEEVKAYKQARHALNYILRSERKVEQHIERLKEVVKSYPNLLNLIRELEVSEKELIKAFSFYTGNFKSELKKLLRLIRYKKIYLMFSKGKKLAIAERRIKDLIEIILRDVEVLIKWSVALDANLKKVKNGVTLNLVNIPNDKPLFFDWSNINISEGRKPAGDYPITNESTQQIVASLELKGNEKVVAILGGGDQVLEILSRLHKGHLYGIDINAGQIILTATKLELIGVLNRKQYRLFLEGKLSEDEKKLLLGHIAKIGNVRRSLVEFVSNTISSFMVNKDDDVNYLEYVNSDGSYQSIRENKDRLSLIQMDLIRKLDFPNNSLDVVYVSNAFDYLNQRQEERLVNELKRVLKKGGRVYACTYGDREDINLSILMNSFKEDVRSYRNGLKKSVKGALGSPKGFGDFFVGVKV